MVCKQQKRVNFNMDTECHQILKALCALKGITISEHINNCLYEWFRKAVYEDNQIQQMFLAGKYHNHGNAYALKEKLLNDLSNNAAV